MEASYNQYVTHLAEKDIVRTVIDSGIIKLVGDWIYRTGQKDYSVTYILENCELPLTDLIIDAFVLVVSSIVFTFLVVEKVLPRLELKTDTKKE